MQLIVSMLAGLVVGIALFLLTRKHATAAVWTAIILGAIASSLFLGSINGWFLPGLGRFGIVGIGLLSGVASALAVGCVLRGERRPLNWVAVAISVPPVLFLIVFGIAELVGPPH